MIFHPDVLLELAREQEQDLIRQAERRRLYRQAERNQSGLLYRINQFGCGGPGRKNAHFHLGIQPLQDAGDHGLYGLTDGFHSVAMAKG